MSLPSLVTHPSEPQHPLCSVTSSPSTCVSANGSDPHLHVKVPFPLLNACRNDAMQHNSLSIHFPSFKPWGFLSSAEFLKWKTKSIQQHPLPEQMLVILGTTCPSTIQIWHGLYQTSRTWQIPPYVYKHIIKYHRLSSRAPLASERVQSRLKPSSLPFPALPMTPRRAPARIWRQYQVLHKGLLFFFLILITWLPFLPASWPNFVEILVCLTPDELETNKNTFTSSA